MCQPRFFIRFVHIHGTYYYDEQEEVVVLVSGSGITRAQSRSVYGINMWTMEVDKKKSKSMLQQSTPSRSYFSRVFRNEHNGFKGEPDNEFDREERRHG